MRKQVLIIALIILLAGVGVFALIQKKNDSIRGGVSTTEPIPTPSPIPSTPNQPFSYGRIDNCCIQGWAYDNDQPLTISVTFQNLDFPNVRRTFTGQSPHQDEFLFQMRNDILPFLETKGVVQVTNPTGFQASFVDQLYPGSYRISNATYNGKPFDSSALGQGAVYHTQWNGFYEHRYNPAGPQYITHDREFDKIVNNETGKEYPIIPRGDLLSTSHARWSPDGKYIAYAYSATPQPNYSSVIFNVLTPQEVYTKNYVNPGRVLTGGDALQFHWLDNIRVLVIQLLDKKEGAFNRPLYGRATAVIYNVAGDSFEYPTHDYPEDVYSVRISPNGEKLLFEVPSAPVSTRTTYIITDISGKELKRFDGVTDRWYLR